MVLQVAHPRLPRQTSGWWCGASLPPRQKRVILCLLSLLCPFPPPRLLPIDDQSLDIIQNMSLPFLDSHCLNSRMLSNSRPQDVWLGQREQQLKNVLLCVRSSPNPFPRSQTESSWKLRSEILTLSFTYMRSEEFLGGPVADSIASWHHLRYEEWGDSQDQWLRLHSFTVKGVGSVPVRTGSWQTME